MPQSVKSRTGTLMPISVMCAGQKLDMSVPSSLIVAELLPGMVEALGRLDPETATQGYRLLTPSGRVLDHSQTLRAQHVTPGTLLTLESEGGSTVDQRYDDLVEAIGTSVNKHQDAWTKGDSAQLSSHCGVILILTAAVLLAIRGGHTMATAIIAAVGAALVCATAAIVARGSSTAGAVSLSLTVPVLARRIFVYGRRHTDCLRHSFAATVSDGGGGPPDAGRAVDSVDRAGTDALADSRS